MNDYIINNVNILKNTNMTNDQNESNLQNNSSCYQIISAHNDHRIDDSNLFVTNPDLNFHSDGLITDRSSSFSCSQVSNTKIRSIYVKSRASYHEANEPKSLQEKQLFSVYESDLSEEIEIIKIVNANQNSNDFPTIKREIQDFSTSSLLNDQIKKEKNEDFNKNFLEPGKFLQKKEISTEQIIQIKQNRSRRNSLLTQSSLNLSNSSTVLTNDLSSSPLTLNETSEESGQSFTSIHSIEIDIMNEPYQIDVLNSAQQTETPYLMTPSTSANNRQSDCNPSANENNSFKVAQETSLVNDLNSNQTIKSDEQTTLYSDFTNLLTKSIRENLRTNTGNTLDSQAWSNDDNIENLQQTKNLTSNTNKLKLPIRVKNALIRDTSNEIDDQQSTINKFKLVVTNLPTRMKTLELRKLFSKCGKIKACKLDFDRNTGNGLVEFQKEEDAQSAFRTFSNFKLENKSLNLSFERKPIKDVKNILIREIKQENQFVNHLCSEVVNLDQKNNISLNYMNNKNYESNDSKYLYHRIDFSGIDQLNNTTCCMSSYEPFNSANQLSQTDLKNSFEFGLINTVKSALYSAFSDPNIKNIFNSKTQVQNSFDETTLKSAISTAAASAATYTALAVTAEFTKANFLQSNKFEFDGELCKKRINNESNAKNIKLHVTNIGEMSSMQLENLFSKYGKVLSANAVEENGLNMGFGYVIYETIDESLRAIDALNGRRIDNRKLNVKFQSNQQKRQTL